MGSLPDRVDQNLKIGPVAFGHRKGGNMAHILIAAAPDEMAHMQRILGTHHDSVCVGTMATAVAALREEEFDLILICVHFDDSRMFELMHECKKAPANSMRPVICFCTRATPLSRAMHHSIAAATTLLGAWTYLTQSESSGKGNPDAEFRSALERCLAGTACQRTQERRVGIQKQREEILLLRQALADEEWSEDVERRVCDLRAKLFEILLHLSKMRTDNIAQQEKLEVSIDRKDCLPAHVVQTEHGILQEERKQVAVEGEQLGKEQEQFVKEAVRAKEGRSPGANV